MVILRMKYAASYLEKIQETFEQKHFMTYFIDSIDTMLNKTIARWKKQSVLRNEEGFRL